MNIDNGMSIMAAVSIFSQLKIKEVNIIMNHEIYALTKEILQTTEVPQTDSQILNGYFSVKGIYDCQGLPYMFVSYGNSMEELVEDIWTRQEYCFNRGSILLV